MLPKQTQNTVAYHEQQYGEDLQQHQGGNISHKLFGPDAIAVFEERRPRAVSPGRCGTMPGSAKACITSWVMRAAAVMATRGSSDPPGDLKYQPEASKPCSLAPSPVVLADHYAQGAGPDPSL